MILKTVYMDEIIMPLFVLLKAIAILSPRLDVSETYANSLVLTTLYEVRLTPSILAFVSINSLPVEIPFTSSRE